MFYSKPLVSIRTLSGMSLINVYIILQWVPDFFCHMMANTNRKWLIPMCNLDVSINHTSSVPLHKVMSSYMNHVQYKDNFIVLLQHWEQAMLCDKIHLTKGKESMTMQLYPIPVLSLATNQYWCCHKGTLQIPVHVINTICFATTDIFDWRPLSKTVWSLLRPKPSLGCRYKCQL